MLLSSTERFGIILNGGSIEYFSIVKFTQHILSFSFARDNNENDRLSFFIHITSHMRQAFFIHIKNKSHLRPFKCIFIFKVLFPLYFQLRLKLKLSCLLYLYVPLTECWAISWLLPRFTKPSTEYNRGYDRQGIVVTLYKMLILFIETDIHRIHVSHNIL